MPRGDTSADQARQRADYPQEAQKHPNEWERDLNPDRMEGQNIGPDHTEMGQTKSAYDHKAAHDLLQDIPDDDLKQIHVVDSGERLQQGAVYVDLRDEGRAPFKASGSEAASDRQLLVPKADTPYPLWNRIARD